MPLALYEIANDVIHILPKDFTIREDTVDRLSDAAQTLSPFLVLKCEVTDFAAAAGSRSFSLAKTKSSCG